MGRLTEVFNVIQNGFGEPEQYHWIEPKDEETRESLKIMRKLAKKVRSTVQEPDLHHFTRGEMEAFCAKLDNLQNIAKPGGMIFVNAVQIIRQLQAELAHNAA